MSNVNKYIPRPPPSSRLRLFLINFPNTYYRPIMQGQRQGGNPPFARKIFASDRAYACEVVPRVRKVHAENCVIYVRAPCQHSNWWANTLATAVFLPFSRK